MIPIKKIIPHLVKDNKSVELPFSTKYEPVSIVKENFKVINGKKIREVFAIDGGSGIIADGGAWLVAKIKVGIVSYEKNKIFEEIKSFYVTIINKKEYEIIINSEKDEVISINLPDFNNLEINEIPAKIMKILEWKTCLQLCKTKPKSFIIMDSSLESENEIEEKLIKSINKYSNIVVGFCKTSRLRTESGRSVLGITNSLSDLKKWIYSPLFKNEGIIKTFICKLNNLSKFCHKVQLFSKEKKVDEIFQTLKFFASDSESLGYPYPLLKVDKIARINHFERQRETKLFERELKKEKIINDVYSQSFHNELDTRMYRR